MSDKCHYFGCHNKCDKQFISYYMNGYRNKSHVAIFCSQQCQTKFEIYTCQRCGACDRNKQYREKYYCTNYPYQTPCYIHQLFIDNQVQCLFCKIPYSEKYRNLHVDYDVDLKNNEIDYYCCHECYDKIKGNPSCYLCNSELDNDKHEIYTTNNEPNINTMILCEPCYNNCMKYFDH